MAENLKSSESLAEEFIFNGYAVKELNSWLTDPACVVRGISVLITQVRAEKDSEVEKLRGEIENLKGEHISKCLYHRCGKHIGVKQLNTKEFSGAECGGCIEEELKTKDENGVPIVRARAAKAARGMA